MAARVAVVGSINVDIVVATETLPEPGETVVASDLRRFGGGKGANQAVAAARTGADVTMIGRVGADGSGERLLHDLRGEGIDLTYVTCAEGPTGTAVITVDAEGENTIVVVPGANHWLGPDEVEAARAAIEPAEALLLQLEVPLAANIRAAQIARGAGVPVFLNPSPVAPLPRELLGAVSYLVLNEVELAVLTAGSLDASELLRAGVGTVVVTRGERGAHVVAGSGVRDVRPYRVESVDSTAAGDAFLGALAATLRELGVEGALDAAAAAGALATTRWGAQPSLPTRGEIEALLRASPLHG